MDSKTARPKRPAGVTLIAVVQALNALSLGVQWLVLPDDPSTPFDVGNDPGVSASLFIALGLTTAIGLWTLKRWAWVATMLWAGLAMFASLVSYFNDEPVSYLTMAVTLLQVFYLNLTEVQRAFAHRRPAEASLG
jgi:hypothetical protein